MTTGKIATATLLSALLAAATATASPVSLSPAVGDEIDRLERDAYRLFPEIDGFVSARILRDADGRPRLEWVAERDGRRRPGSRPLTEEALELTRRHVAWVERAAAARTDDDALEARILERMALRSSLSLRYDQASELLEELRREHPARWTPELEALALDARRLDAGEGALFRRGALWDRSGRTDLLIFAGYYGVWLGAALPAAFDATSENAYAASLLAVPTASVLAAHLATRDAHVTDGDAALVSLGGRLGTWQGLGWAGVGERESEDVLGWGIAAGLGGIAAGAALAAADDFPEGDVELVDAGMVWGAWLGLLAAIAADTDDGDDTLAAMLVASDALVVGTALTAPAVDLTRGRVRLMNLGGVVGALFGGGVLILAKPDSEAALAGVLGASSLSGAAIALAATRPRAPEGPAPWLGAAPHGPPRRGMAVAF